MMHRLYTSTAVFTIAVLLAAGAFAAPKPSGNQAPVVTAFDVPAESASPIPVVTLTATDTDGSVAGYLITESPAVPSATAPGWSVTPPNEYATSGSGAVTLYAWAKDNANAVSSSKSDTVVIPSPPVNADTLDGMDSTAFALAAHGHVQSDVAGLATALAAKADIAHDHDAIYPKKYANVIVVAKNGGDFDDPVRALDSILDASPSNTYLVKVMPGTYQIGSRSLIVPSNVDLEGSGERITSIIGAGYPNTHNVIVILYESEIRDMTIEQGGEIQDSHSYGIVSYAPVSACSRITNVTLRMGAPGRAPIGMLPNNRSEMRNVHIVIDAYGQLAHGIQLITPAQAEEPSILKDVSITILNGGGYGILTSARLTAENLSVTASGTVVGVRNNGNALIKNSDIQGQVINVGGGGLTIVNSRISDLVHQEVDYPATNTRVSFTEVTGTLVNDGIGLSCFGIHDSALAPISCP